MDEVLLKGGKFLRLVKFVSVSDIKQKLGVLAAEKIFPGAIYRNIAETHSQEEVECVNRLKKSLWKRLYKHVSSGPTAKVTDDSVADMYTDQLAKGMLEEVPPSDYQLKKIGKTKIQKAEKAKNLTSSISKKPSRKLSGKQEK